MSDTVIIAIIGAVPLTLSAVVGAFASVKGRAEGKSNGLAVGELHKALNEMAKENAADHARVRGDVSAMRQDQSTLLELFAQHVGNASMHS
jgi:carbonic anhydrase/acetyltransferase-like protein (isoleucine patch superfamily)